MNISNAEFNDYLMQEKFRLFAPMIIDLFFLNAIELLFIGFVGEYAMSINTRVMNRLLVIEEERINF